MFFYRILMSGFDTMNGRYITDFHHVRIESWMSTWLIPFFSAAIIALCVYHYSRVKGLDKRQRAILITLRSLAYIFLLFILAMPKLVIEGEGALPGPVPVIIDGTDSMQIKDADDKTRFAKSLDLYKSLNENNNYKKDLMIEGYFAGKEIRQFKNTEKLTPDGDYTSINQMLEKSVEKYLGEYMPGVVLISDGAHNTSELPDNIIKYFQKLNIPVYACGVGKEKSKDVSVDYILGEEVVFLNEKAKIYVNINQNGYTNEDAGLKLFLGDKEVYSGRHKLEHDGEISIPVEYVPHTKGIFQLKAEITPMPGEVTVENNVYIKNVRVIDEKIKILMVFGAPSWEYRYLMGTFERDKRVEVKSYLASADKRIFKKSSGKTNLLSTLPNKNFNKSFDIIILSKIDVAALSPEFVKNLCLFVEEDGGAMAVISDLVQIPYSIKGTPLEDLMPITISERTGRSYKDEMFSILKDEMHFEITDDGSAHQLVAFSGNKDENKKIWAELPPAYNCYASGRLKPSSISLMAIPGTDGRQKIPAIVYHSYGKGTVLFMAFDSTWRWRKEFGDRYFRDFWGKAVQFLGLPHLLSESAQSTIFVGKETCFTGEKIAIHAKINNPDYSPVIIEQIKMKVTENGIEKSLDLSAVPGRLGMYKADYIPEVSGDLKFELPAQYSANPVNLRVTKPQMEFHNSGMNKILLEKIALATGGGFYTPEQCGKIFEDIYKNRHKIPISVRVSLWDSMLLLILSLIFFSAEWYFRKIYYLD